MELQSIFHAFNMKYSHIAEIAPRLATIGFTHIQFPPIQTTRQLSELDIELLREQIATQDIQMHDFERLCVLASQKNNMYAPHNYSYLLRKRIEYIRQPLLRDMHQFIMHGASAKNILEYLYTKTEYGKVMACAMGAKIDVIHITTVSPIIKLIASIQQVGKTHPQYVLLEVIELMMKWSSHLHSFTDNDERMLNDLNTKYKNMQKEIQMERTNERLRTLKSIKLEYSKLKEKQSHAKIYDRIKELLPVVKDIRSTFFNSESFIGTIRTTRTTRFKNALPSFDLNIAKSWLNIATIAELIVYSPWWLIYQPVELAIGDTLLGTKGEIENAIAACNSAGLSVITDIVVNNLAAIPGERDAWKPAATPPQVGTLSEIQSYYRPETLQKARQLLHNAFGSEDLSMVTPPYECRKGQPPTLCWMSGALPQLNQDHPRIQSALQKFLQSLKALEVAGVRIDAAAHLQPSVCVQIIQEFPGLSYIEYVGEAPYLYSKVRLEDFAIGEDLYLHIFSEQAQYTRLKNYGGDKLSRVENLDSVVMIVNHDHVMGSIPSQVFAQLPSEITYELSVVYLLQRIYGTVLVMPHDLEFMSVQKAVGLRRKMLAKSVNSESVQVMGNYIRIEKYNSSGLCFVVYINMNGYAITTEYGVVDGYSFEYYEVEPVLDEQVFNRVATQKTTRSKTKRAKRTKQTRRNKTY